MHLYWDNMTWIGFGNARGVWLWFHSQHVWDAAMWVYESMVKSMLAKRSRDIWVHDHRKDREPSWWGSSIIRKDRKAFAVKAEKEELGTTVKSQWVMAPLKRIDVGFCRFRKKATIPCMFEILDSSVDMVEKIDSAGVEDVLSKWSPKSKGTKP